MLERIKSILFPADIDEVIAYQYKMPDSISVAIKKTRDGYIARVDKINEQPISDTTFLVEAKDARQLVNEVNDMLFTYLDFPSNVKDRMPRLLPPEMVLHSPDILSGVKQREFVFAK